MNSRTTERFRRTLGELAPEVRRRAREAYKTFAENPNHPGLRFKRVHAKLMVYSARIDLNHRALGILDGDTIVWFWIGPHDEYERLLRSM